MVLTEVAQSDRFAMRASLGVPVQGCHVSSSSSSVLLAVAPLCSRFHHLSSPHPGQINESLFVNVP